MIFWSSSIAWLVIPLFLATIKFFTNNYHLMIMLLVLEFLMLLNMVISTYAMTTMALNAMFYLIFFIVSVGEACVGLSILVHMSRTAGEELKRAF